MLKKMLKKREDNQASILAKKLDRLWIKKQKEKESKVRQLRTENIKSTEIKVNQKITNRSSRLSQLVS